jgi:guanine deaminase
MQSGYIVYINDKIEDVYKVLPERLQRLTIIDYGSNLIIPGMSDLHIHAPQYPFRGIGQNIENNEWNKWFERYAFPEERRYNDLIYAERAYTRLVNDLLRTPTTRVCVFATIHREATELLMSILNDYGFGGYIGKVNMDRNSINGLIETTEESIKETEKWLHNTLSKYSLIHPIITPRYIPSCTDSLMERLGALIEEYKVPIQSHLSEGLDEINWVKKLKPEIKSYSEGYKMYHMMGDIVPVVQAHCVYPTQQDILNMTNHNFTVAHCPGGNMHSSGGVAPIMKYIKAGIRVGLGTDIAGGSSISLFRVLMEGIMASKVWWAENEQKGDPNATREYLSLTNALYLATKGGGSFFGLVGSFEPDYALDAVVIDERRFSDENDRSVYERLERAINLSDDRDIVAKYINGKQII